MRARAIGFALVGVAAAAASPLPDATVSWGALRWAAAAPAAAAIAAPPAAGLPDGRAYELVTQTSGPAGTGTGAGVSGVNPNFLASSQNGEAVDWEGFGGCCGAESGALNLYRSVRSPSGWHTEAITPTPSQPLTGLAFEQVPLAWTSDLQRTIFATPASYAPGDHRPRLSRAEDLYLQEGSGAMSWISQGPTGTGSSPVSAELDGATPDLEKIVFSSAESLTEDATGLGSENTPPQYLYLRDVSSASTALLDVDNNGALISPYGATLGNGSWLHEEPLLSDYTGTTTNAISSDGAKVFFEAPPPGDAVEGAKGPHLYMRDLDTGTTTPLDEPSASGSATYEGASADGSLVFFTSNEGLDGAPQTRELYEFNTTSSPIGPAPASSAIAIAGGKGAIGETAIANDGSTVYFVSQAILASNANPVGSSAREHEPNLYSFDTRSGSTTYVATLAWPDVSGCDPDCTSERPAGLIAQPDVERPAYPTPDGSVLVFASYSDLTGQAADPQTTLTAEGTSGARTLTVASTSGFYPGQAITIGAGPSQEPDTIAAVEAPNRITLAEYGPDGLLGLAENHPAGSPVTLLHTEIYRYSADERSLACISCAPPGAPIAGAASLGQSDAGGSYAPAGRPAPLSENGAQVFFESSEPLVSEAQPPAAGAVKAPENVYEWEAGQVHLISNGSAAGFSLDGTDPSGEDVYFTTNAQLTAIDTGGELEIYDARVGGSTPQGPNEPEACQEEACRPTGTGSGKLAQPPTPGSAILGAEGGLEEQGPSVTPKIALARTTAAQQRRFARSGRLLLTVSATGPGTIAIDVTAPIHGRRRRVAYGAVTLEQAATATVALTLDRAAREQLASAGTLRLSLTLSDSAGGPHKSFALVLRAPHAHASARATARHV